MDLLNQIAISLGSIWGSGFVFCIICCLYHYYDDEPEKGRFFFIISFVWPVPLVIRIKAELRKFIKKNEGK